MPGLSKTVAWTPVCWGGMHREGKRREKLGSQRCQSHEDGVEQEDLFESTLISRPPALQYPRFTNPLQPKKNLEGERKQKCTFLGVGAGNLKKKTNIPVDGEFSPIMFLTSSSFQNTSYHWIKRFSSYGKPHLAQNLFWVLLWPVLRYYIHSTPPG